MHTLEHTQLQQETGFPRKKLTLKLGGQSLAATVRMEHGEAMQDTSFGLTPPESRTYSPDEQYRFLVHVPGPNVANRAGEIGLPRNGAVLMTSLVSNYRTATFQGEGGIIVAEPNPTLVTGISAFDVGGEIQGGVRADLSELLTPATNSDYNQIDMKFEATRPIGVLVKRAASDGHELGSAGTNATLREYAAQHDLPVVEILVTPDTVPTEMISHQEQTQDHNRLVTVDIPYMNDHYFRVQVLHGAAYAMEDGEDTMARVMTISAYGEAPQALSLQEREKVFAGLQEALSMPESIVTQKDIDTVRRDLDRLDASRQNH